MMRGLRFAATAVVVSLGAMVGASMASAQAVSASSVTAQSSPVKLNVGAATVTLQLVAPGVLHVHYVGSAGATPPALVINPALSSHLSGTPGATVTRNGDSITLRSSRMTAVWDGSIGRLVVRSANGQPLVWQSDLSALGVGRIVLGHPSGDSFYGVGRYTVGANTAPGVELEPGDYVARAGSQGHAGAPFVWSTAGFGILVDCNGGRFNLSTGQTVISGFVRPDPDYYILVGSPMELFGELSKISGPAPMFPKWSMGFMASQWGLNQAKLTNFIKEYRAKDIPIDNYILDFDWKPWGDGHYGEFRWNAQNFPGGPSGDFAREMLTDYGVHISGIMKPRIHIDTVEGRYATAHNFWFPGEDPYMDYYPLKGMDPTAHMMVMNLNFQDAAARKWFGGLAVKYGFDKGIAGWWNDEADETGSNLEFMNMQRSLYDAQRAASNKRVWSLNRNFWLGSQRYAYGLWSGDISTGFKTMAAQRTRMLDAIEVGEMNWGMDGGGFHGHPSDENYARWIEFDAFAPIFRIHGTFNQQRQPWVFGPVAEADVAHAIRLRYKLIPYIYAYQYQNLVHGVGVVRPLTFGWPGDPHVRNDVSSWMFGRWLLVSPVVKEGQTTKPIYLPSGSWTEWSTGKVYQGGETINLPVDSKTWRDIPLFIRAGAIIPMQPVMQYVGQHPVKTITVQAFPSASATHFDYYDDDGETYSYQKGDYFLQRMTLEKSGNAVDLKLAAVKGSYQPALRDYLLEIHGLDAARVRIDGKQLRRETGLAAVQTSGKGWATGHDRYGDVTWVMVPAGKAADVQAVSKS